MIGPHFVAHMYPEGCPLASKFLPFVLRCFFLRNTFLNKKPAVLFKKNATSWGLGDR